MKKKIVALIIIPIILLTIFYCRPIKVSNLIHPMSSKNLPLKVESAIFFSAHSKKELDVNTEECLEELTELMGDIKVIKKITTLKSYRPQFKETYGLIFYGEDNKYHYIDILNSEYIRINNRYYKIVGTPDLSRVYDIIILDQAEETLDKFYYNFIESN